MLGSERRLVVCRSKEGKVSDNKIHVKTLMEILPREMDVFLIVFYF